MHTALNIEEGLIYITFAMPVCVWVCVDVLMPSHASTVSLYVPSLYNQEMLINAETWVPAGRCIS